MPETFESIHNDDLGNIIGVVKRGDSKPIDSTVASMFREFTRTQAEVAGIVDGIPIRSYYPESIEAREKAYRKRLIDLGRSND